MFCVCFVKPLFAFFNVPSCLCGLCYGVLSESEPECFPIVPMQFVFCFLEVVLVFQPSTAAFYCFCLNAHAFLCAPSHSALPCSIFSVMYLQCKLIESAEMCFALLERNPKFCFDVFFLLSFFDSFVKRFFLTLNF